MQLFRATFVKNKCNFFRILLQQKLALFIVFNELILVKGEIVRRVLNFLWLYMVCIVLWLDLNNKLYRT